jgi:peptide/nickel transport system ATP-binding protein
MMDAAEPVLGVENLNVWFDKSRETVHAVRNVSFSLNRSEVLGLAGESGSGKSVSLRSILGLLPSNARATGTITVEGTEFAADCAERFASIRGLRIGMIFQNPSSHLDPLRRIGWQIAAPMRRHLGIDQETSRRKTLSLLHSVGIANFEQRIDAYPHELSGGMKQRVMIAGAIGPGPSILLADEPTTALDVTVQARILQLLRDLNRKHGLSIILVSHDLGVLAETCDRLLIMRQGEIVDSGQVRKVLSSPSHPYTQLLVASQPALRTAAYKVHHELEPKQAPLLDVHCLRVEFSLRRSLFGDTQMLRAIDDVSFSLSRGETLGIVGESGSGKSTLARAIVLLNRPAAGTIVYEGTDIRGLRGEELRRYRLKVQMVFQHPYESLNPRLTVSRTLDEAITWRRKCLGENGGLTAQQLLEMVELPQRFLTHFPSELSGGQCQRVGIARALAVSPTLLIADEITSALDVTTQAQILDLLERLQREQNLTLLYISHDLAVVRSLCRAVLVLHNGKIVERGPTQQVLSNPREPYTQELINAIPASF